MNARTLHKLKLVRKHSVNDAGVGSNGDGLRVSAVRLEAAGHGEETTGVELALVRSLELRARDDKSTGRVTYTQKFKIHAISRSVIESTNRTGWTRTDRPGQLPRGSCQGSVSAGC